MVAKKETMLPKLKRAGREILAYARQAALLGRTGAVLPDAASPGDDVVVCLHGIFASGGALGPMRQRLEERGVSTAALSYPAGPGIAELSKQVARICERLGDVRIHLLGHSLGGVVARHYACTSGDRRVVQTISLASPFAGLPMGRYGVLDLRLERLGIGLMRDLDRSSAVLRQLRISGYRLPHLSIVAAEDHILPAPLSHALPGGEVQVFYHCGHNALLFDGAVASSVEQRVFAYSRRAAGSADDPEVEESHLARRWAEPDPIAAADVG